jgi:hypothetical protein
MGLIVALAAVLAGCQGPAIGTIKADRAARDQLQQRISDRPAKPGQPGKASKRPDLNDLSLKLPGVEARP